MFLVLNSAFVLKSAVILPKLAEVEETETFTCDILATDLVLKALLSTKNFINPMI